MVLVHDALAHCRALFRSLRITRDVDYEIVVVDNGSSWPTRWYLRSLRARRRIDRLVAPGANTLFAVGNNLGVEATSAACQFVLLLNSDVVVEDPLWLRKLLDLHRGGATAYGAIVDDVWPRADGYCLLVDRDLYLRHPLDERFEWWWCTSRLQAELLAAGHRVRALRDHSGIIRHAFGGSGGSYAGARGMETDRATVRGWFGGRRVELL